LSAKYDHDVVKHDPQEGFDGTEPAHRQITFFVVVSLIALAAVIGAIQMYFDDVWDALTYENVLAVPGQEVGQLRALEAWRLTHYEFAEPSKTTVRLPFERAKELFLQEAAQGRTFYPGRPTEPKPEQPAEAPADGKQQPAGKQETKQ
jgi:hypothetical protein